MAAALFCLGLASCSDDFGRYGGANGEKIKVTVPDFKMGEGFEDLQTRTAVDLSNKQYITSWTEGDYIDVFALSGQFEGTAASSSHVKFEITDIAEGNEAHARFQGDGYGLVEGYEYAAYYPYKTGNDYPSNAVELSYDYSGTTITPDATDHIADFDYLVAKPQIPENQKVTLNFEHVGTLVRLRVYCPNAGTYNKIVLESPDEDAFVKTATLNVSDGSTTITETTDAMEFPITPTEVSENGTVTIYFMVHPNNYKSKLLNVYIIGDDNSWNGTVVGKDFAKGNAESLNVVANKKGGRVKNNGHDYVDLGLPSGTLWATMNVGATDEISTNINPTTGFPDYFGQYYCFGETNGYNEAPTAYSSDWTGSTNSNYSSLTSKTDFATTYYKWYNCGRYINEGDELDIEDDAAYVNWGGDWRTPTYGQLVELADNCVFIPVTSYKGTSVLGCLVYLAKNSIDKGMISKVPSGTYTLEEPHIFIPYSGYASGTYKYGAYSGAYLMSSKISTIGTIAEYGMVIGNNAPTVHYNFPPVYLGVSVRPVISTNNQFKRVYNNEEDYVDLGLSVKWAKMNVGATEVAGKKINSRTGVLDCYGEYYAWGETEPKDAYTGLNYKWYSASDNIYKKYTFSDGRRDRNYYSGGVYVGTTVDGVNYMNLTTIEPCDDAAHANLGGSWRIPTKDEIQELIDNCYWEFTQNYCLSDVSGVIIYKAKSDSDKGKVRKSRNTPVTLSAIYNLSDPHIFIPIGGHFWYEGGLNESALGNSTYLNSSSIGYESYVAYCLSFGRNSISELSSSQITLSNMPKYYGMPIRAVHP